jgi:hypothetical protein
MRRRVSDEVETRIVGRLVESPRELRVIGETDGVWTGGTLPTMPGALVWVEPPADASDELVDDVERVLRGTGAAKVLVAARRRGKPIAPEMTASIVAETHREIVAALIASANVVDRQALAVFCENIMTEVQM